MKKQNYRESKSILEEINKAGRILLNCHRGPDPDSIGNSLALHKIILDMGKDVEIICPSEHIDENLSFLKDYSKIRKGVDFKTFDFSAYDLFIVTDSSSWDMVSGDAEIPIPNIPILVIDHHFTNTRFGNINLIDVESSAVCELVYKMIEDWDIRIDANTADALLSGIVGDTGIFKYPNTTQDTFSTVLKLLEAGAHKEKVVANIYRSNSYNLIKFWGECLINLKIDKENRFVYSLIPYEVFLKWGKPENAKDTAVDLFAQTTSGTDFGFLGVEREPNVLSLSFRARNDFDTSPIAVELGGGGHKAASGGKIELPFDEAVEKVLEVARKYAKKGK